MLTYDIQVSMENKSKHIQAWRKRTKERIMMTMGDSCVCCGYNKCQRSLALHHLDPNEKDFSFGKVRANPQSWSKIVAELRKCVLICHNCHGEVHEGIINVPKTAARFNETYSDYKIIERKEREEDPARYHPCPRCGNDTPNYQKHCSRKCSAAAALAFPWDKFDLEKMFQEMSVLPDMWINKSIYESNNPIVPFEKLPLLNHDSGQRMKKQPACSSDFG